MKKRKFNRYINVAGAVKGFFGAVGGSAIVMDYKWVGLSILAIGALADQIMIFLQKEKEDLVETKLEVVPNEPK